jgi:hypothetical protein
MKSFLSSHVIASIQADSMDDYIHQRFKSQLIRVSDENELKMSKQILSNLLTFPLSLSNGIARTFDENFHKDIINVTVVGARAESSLSLFWWKEMLYQKSLASIQNSHLNLKIRMIGPGVQRNSSFSNNKFSSVLSWNEENNLDLKRNLEFLNPFAPESIGDFSVLHQHPRLLDLLHRTDLFVLFNPGYGSTTLKSSWKPTISLLLETRKPIMCTAFNEEDLSNDLKQLRTVSEEDDHQELGDPLEFYIKASSNPFSSLRKYVSETSRDGDIVKKEIIRTNAYYYIFQAK